MRILFFSHYFPPEVNAPASRTFEHCREWARAGHDVHVITCVPSHPRGIAYRGYRSGWYRRERIDGVTVHRVWTWLAPNRGVAKRTINFLSFVPTAVWRACRLGAFDVIVGTSPQFFCAVAAWLAATVKSTPWVFELRDLWPDSIAAVGVARRYMPLRLLERLELHMYRSARAVVCVSEAFVRNLERRGIDPIGLRYVPNGIDPDVWRSASREAGRRRLGAPIDAVVVSYIGTVGLAHDIDAVLDAAIRIRAERPDVRFAIVGDGAELERLKSRARVAGLTNVAFTGLVPREHVPEYLAGSDICLVTLRPSDVFKTVLPSKMFEAMAVSRPILLAVEGEAQRILERAGAGLPVTPGDSAALARAICDLADDPARREAMGAAGARFVAREFSRPTWARRYLHLLRQCCDELPGRAPQSVHAERQA